MKIPGSLQWALRDARLARLVRRSQRGDREAFRRLYRELYEPVFRFVRNRVGLQADVEDLVSQVFFRLLKSLQTLDPRRGSVIAYAISVARRLVSDHNAVRSSIPAGDGVTASIPDESLGPLERLVLNEQGEALRAELAALPNDALELLLLRFVDELPYADIAQVLELTEAAVRQRVSRVIRELRATWAARWEKRELVR